MIVCVCEISWLISWLIIIVVAYLFLLPWAQRRPFAKQHDKCLGQKLNILNGAVWKAANPAICCFLPSVVKIITSSLKRCSLSIIDFPLCIISCSFPLSFFFVFQTSHLNSKFAIQNFVSKFVKSHLFKSIGWKGKNQFVIAHFLLFTRVLVYWVNLDF